MKWGLAAFLSLFLPMAALCQLELPVPVVLSGSENADRQVRGLGDPLLPSGAVSVDAARTSVVARTTTTGSTVLIGGLTPPATFYSIGMLLTVVPTEANAAGPTLDIDNIGPRPILKYGQVPLDSADLRAGVPVRVVYNGSAFLLLNTTSRPCPSTMHPGSAIHCISDSAIGIGTFFEAVSNCASRGQRLCSYGEWIGACRRDPAFIATVISPEWVDDGANSGSDAKVVGGGSDGQVVVPGLACNYGSSVLSTLTSQYRCCYDR